MKNNAIREKYRVKEGKGRIVRVTETKAGRTSESRVRERAREDTERVTETERRKNTHLQGEGRVREYTGRENKRIQGEGKGE